MLLCVSLSLDGAHVKTDQTNFGIVGNESRKAIQDGFPAENIVTTDIGRGESNFTFQSFEKTHTVLS